MALFCRANRAEQCPVSGAKQPCRRNRETAEVDPNETLDTWAPRQSSRLLRSLLSRHRHGKNLDGALNMKLYVTYGSPYARLARIIVIEKALEDRVEIIEAKTRTPGSPYYQINPSGRVPYLVDDTGVGMEDSQLICAYLDGLDGKPRFHNASHASDWAYLRLEFAARSMCDGIAVWGREIARPENERSPTTLAHKSARAQRMADFFEDRATDPLIGVALHGAPDPCRRRRDGAQARAGDLTAVVRV